MSNISTRLVPHLIPANKDGFTTEQLKRNFESINRLSADFTARQIQHIGTTSIQVGTGAATAETILQTIPFSAGLMGKSGIIQYTAWGTAVGNAGTRTVRVNFNRGSLPGNLIATLKPVANPALLVNWYITGYLVNAQDSSIQNFGSLAVDPANSPYVNIALGGTSEDTDVNTAGNETAKSFFISTTGQTSNAGDEILSNVLSVTFIPGL
jgi:hypothetical protein